MRGHVLCLLGIAPWVLKVVFLKGSEIWAAEEAGEANPLLVSLNLENLEELMDFLGALKLSAEVCACVCVCVCV